MAVEKTVESAFDIIANMSLMEISELTELMEEKFGVSAAAAVVAAAPGAAAETASAEQTEFNVVLTSFGSSKVGVIKVVRSLTSLGLKEAKELVEAVPSAIKESVPKEEAEDVKKKLEAAGGSAEIK